MLAKILIPLDGSPLSEHILLHARRILMRQDAEVTLLRVVPPDGVRNPAFAEETFEEARSWTTAIQERLTREGARVRTEIRRGDPSQEILAFADGYEPSLIAMSTHGRSGFDRWVWGSVTERVLRHSRHPLLLANPKALEGKLPADLRYSRILVPLDGSQPSAEVLPLVEEVGLLYESSVMLLYAEPIAIASLQYPAVPFVPSKEEGEKLLEPYCKRIEARGLRAAIEVSFKSPAQAVLDAAEEWKADLVAMTTHGRSGFSRWALGSVAEKVVRHSPCPVLVRRTSGFNEGGER